MNHLVTLARSAAGACRRAWSRFWDRFVGARLYKVVRINDEPKNLARNVVYIIEDAGQAWSAVMACPGGCGQALHMNLIPDTKPVWRLAEHPDRTVTLEPSVWRREGCGCHFHLRRGRVEWCG